MTILITGINGFIGFHTAYRLLSEGHEVVGIDNLNNYYNPSLKIARAKFLKANHSNVIDYQADIKDFDSIKKIASEHPSITHLIHLAARPGVRSSITSPHLYIEDNVNGFFNVLETCRHHLPNLQHLVYASSSSVYGHNSKLPFSINDRTAAPASLYGATKLAGETMSYSYSHLYNIPTTGLRFFTVYGPWGRPDMALYIFTKAILEQSPIELYGQNCIRRDFTYIDDIVDAICSCLSRKKKNNYEIYNLGNNKTESLEDFLAVIEEATGRKAITNQQPMQLGDMKETFADITESVADLGFNPKVGIREGIPKFVDWFRSYTGH